MIFWCDMEKRVLLMLLAVVLIIPVVAAIPLSPPPPAPASDFLSLYGTVRVNNAAASDGTSMTFKVNGVEYGTTVVNGGEYAYIISEGGNVSDADTVAIYVSGSLALTTIFQAPAVKNLNLSVSTGGEGDDDDDVPPPGSGSSGGGGGRAREEEKEVEIGDVVAEDEKSEDESFDIDELIEGAGITGASVGAFLRSPTTIIGLLLILLAIVVLASYSKPKARRRGNTSAKGTPKKNKAESEEVMPEGEE